MNEIFDQISVQDIVTDVYESGCLGESDRQKQLLSYLLKSFAKGEIANVKAYSIAVDVLDRPDDFDPTTDSIVRVEMHRLRKNLVEYTNQKQKYEVLIPKGCFEPKVCFTSHASQKEVRRPNKIVTAMLSAASLCVLAFFAINNSFLGKPSKEIYPTVGIGIIKSDFSLEETRDFVVSLVGLHPHPGIVVFSENTKDRPNEDVDLTVEIALSVGKNDLNVSATPIYPDGSTGRRKLFTFPKTQGLSPLVYKTVAFWITNPKNEILRKFAISGDRAEIQNETFKCMLDTIRWYYDDELKFGDNQRLWSCIDGYVTKSIYEEYVMSFFKGYLLARQSNGEVDYGVADPNIRIQEHIGFMKSVHFDSVLIYELEIPLIQKEKPLNKDKLRTVLLERISNYEMMGKEISNTSIQFGLVLGDWQIAMKLLEQYFAEVGPNNRSIGFYIETAFHVNSKNFLDARSSFHMIPNTKSYQVSSFGITIGCNISDDEMIAKALGTLREFEFGTWEKYSKKIRQSNLHDDLKAVLTDEQSVMKCFG